MRLKRRNFAWLALLGALVGIAVLSGVAAVEVSVTLIALYLIALAATVLDFQPEQIMDRSRSSLTMMRMSSEAREAVERARRRGSYVDDALTLLDVGLISSQSNREGMVMRRTRNVSLDDDGVRPFITLHVQPSYAEEVARIRFEIIDGQGKPQYVHETRTYLRDGEMNILADHQLPLYENANALQSGDWDLRVYVNGTLLGAHTFMLAPSLQDRFRRFEQRDSQGDVQRGGRRESGREAEREAGREAERLSLREDREEEERALSLEELLRSRSDRRN